MKTIDLTNNEAEVAIIMGSDSDWPTMRAAAEIMEEFGVSYHKQVVSAHRTPWDMAEFARDARKNGFKIIIAGAGGAAHLPGMVAAHTVLPVIGVPVKSRHMNGLDSLYSIVQMPKGIPVATVAIDNAMNAGLLAIRILASADEEMADRLETYHAEMAEQSRAKTENLK